MEINILLRRLIAGIGIALLLMVFVIPDETGRLLLYVGAIMCSLVSHFTVTQKKMEPTLPPPLRMKGQLDPFDVAPIPPPESIRVNTFPAWKKPQPTFEDVMEETADEVEEAEEPTPPRQKVKPKSTGKYCNECGVKNSKTAKFCSGCGSEL